MFSWDPWTVMDGERLPLASNGDLPGHTHKDGLALLTTSLFAVGQMTGTGVLTLPAAMTKLGVIGFVLLVGCEVTCAYTGTLLGRSIVLVQKRYVEYQDHPRYPYPALGMVTYGNYGRLLVSFFLNTTLFGTAIIYLLLSASNVQHLISYIDDSISYCWWLIIVAVSLWPITWLGRPKDFWPIGVISAVVIILASWLITTQVVIDADNTPAACYKPLNVDGFLYAIGILVFAPHGHSAFPSFQVDMRESHKFSLAVIVAYIIQFSAFGPVSIAGYVVYGSSLSDNILASVSDEPLALIAEIFLTIHFLFGFNTNFNPVCLEGEEILGIPKDFGYKRVLFRTLLVCVALFTAASVPQFSFIVSLLGGLTCSALTFICPAIFYIKLCSMKGEWQPIEVSLLEKVACITIVLTGIFILFGVTFSSLLLVLSSNFSKPCYLS